MAPPTARRVGMLTILASALIAEFAAAGETAYIYVNPRTGSDTASGLVGSPMKTVNNALATSYCLRYPSAAGCPSNPNYPDAPYDDVVIKVFATLTPVAPLEFGGAEVTGWRTPTETGSHPALPLRLIEHVSLEGIRGTGGSAAQDPHR